MHADLADRILIVARSIFTRVAREGSTEVMFGTDNAKTIKCKASAPSPRSVDDVERNRGSDRIARILARREHAHPYDYADFAGEVVFDRRRQSEGLTGAGVERHELRWNGNVVSRHSCVVLMSIRRVEGKHPASSDAVFTR